MAMDPNVMAHVRREPGAVSIEDRGSPGRAARRSRGPGEACSQRDAVQEQAERAALVFHAFLVSAVQFAAAAVEHVQGQVVTALVEVAHARDLAPIRFVSTKVSTYRLLRICPYPGEGLAELGEVSAARQHLQHASTGRRPTPLGPGRMRASGGVAARATPVSRLRGDVAGSHAAGSYG
jgi:hypothetical protein